MHRPPVLVYRCECGRPMEPRTYVGGPTVKVERRFTVTVMVCPWCDRTALWPQRPQKWD